MVDTILKFFSENFSTLAWLAVFIVAMLPIAEAKVAIPFGMAVEVWGAAALSPSVAAIIAFIGSTIPAIFIMLFLRPIFDYLKKTKTFNGLIVKFEKTFKRKSEREISVSYLKSKFASKKEKAERESHYSVNFKENNLALVNGQKYSTLTRNFNMTTGATINSMALKQEFVKKEVSTFKKLVTLLFFVALPLPLAGVWTSSAIAAFTDVKFWPGFFAIAFGNLIEVIFITIICYLFKESIMIVLIVALVLLLIYVVIMIILNKRGNRSVNSVK